MKKFATTVLLLALLATTLVAQSPEQFLFTPLWEQSTGTPDTVSWSASCTDGSRNLVTVGNTLTATESTNLLATKRNRSGQVVWQQTYNNAYDKQDYGVAVVTGAADTIYVAAASFNGTTNDYDFNVLKYDPNGNLMWQTTYNGFGGKADIPSAIALGSNGEVYVCGASFYSPTRLYDYLTIRVNRNGVVAWASYYDYNNLYEIPSNVYCRGSRLFVTGGSGVSLVKWEFATVGYNAATGAQVSANRSGNSGVGFDRPTALAGDAQGNLYVTGTSHGANGYDLKLLKLDSSLNAVWTRYVDLDGEADQGNDVKLDASGNVFVTGYGTRDGNRTAVLLKYDAAGNLLWQTEENALDSAWSEGCRLAFGDNGNVFVAGQRQGNVNKDVYIRAYNATGNSIGYKENKGLYKGDDRPVYLECKDDTLLFEARAADSDSTFTYLAGAYKLDEIKNVPSPHGSLSSSISFWENRGQLIDADDSLVNNIRYYTETGQSLFFTDTNYSYVLTKIDSDTATADTLVRVDVKYENGNSDTRINSLGEISKDYLNYLLARCAPGISNVAGYKRLVSKGIYRDIDVVYTWSRSGFNPRIVCNPGSNPYDILIKYQGADSLWLDVDSNLIVHTAAGNIVVHKPTVYQLDDNDSIIVLTWPGQFQIESTNEVSFITGSYDNAKRLVYSMERGGVLIDAGVEWSTYYGGNGEQEIVDSHADADNFMYYTGHVNDFNFPLVTGITVVQSFLEGYRDAFVMRFKPDASRVFVTYYGTDWNDYGNSICTDPNGLIYMCGQADYSGLIGAINPYAVGSYTNVPEGFVMQLKPNGFPVNWCRYIGGSGSDRATGVAFEPASNKVWVVGMTESTEMSSIPFPTMSLLGSAYYQTSHHGGWDGYVARFDPSGNQEWSTFFGGANNDWIYDIGVWPGSSTKIYLTGGTSSDNPAGYTTDGITPCTASVSNTGFPDCYNPSTLNEYHQAFGGVDDAFVAEFDQDGKLWWSTYFGGAGSEVLFYTDEVFPMMMRSQIACRDEYCYIVGTTTSATDFPLAPAFAGPGLYVQATSANEEAYAANFQNRKLHWSSLIGGAERDWGKGITVSDDGNFFICGMTNSDPVDPMDYCSVGAGFPLCDLGGDNYFQDYHTARDGFVMAFSKHGELYWSTFLGGGLTNPALDADDEILKTITKTDDGKLYVAGHSVSPSTPPTASYPQRYLTGAYNQNTYGGGMDAVITRFGPSGLPVGVEQSIRANLIESSLYPNPAESFTTLFVSWDKPATLQVELVNILGQIVRQTDVTIQKGFNRIELNLSGLPAGFYTVNLQQLVVHKLLKTSIK